MGSDYPKKRIGLALGGGIARGMAHIGVLEVLIQAGIPVDFVAGTSSGSLIGAAFCAGRNISHIKSYASKFRWWKIARPIWPVRGLLSFDRLENWFIKEIGDLQFDDLHIPFVVVATDLESGKPVVLRTGHVARAIQASCSIPFVVAPVEIDGKLLVDGGISDMVPVSILREMGADYIIGVDIFLPKIRRSLGPLGYGFAALETMLERAGGGIEQADCLISPNLCGKTYFRFSKYQEMYQLGRDATLDKLFMIRRALEMEPYYDLPGHLASDYLPVRRSTTYEDWPQRVPRPWR
jgi:NTE family protein